MSLTNIGIAADIVLRAAALIARAIEAKRDVTDEELATVFARADRADDAWKAGLAPKPANDGH